MGPQQVGDVLPGGGAYEATRYPGHLTRTDGRVVTTGATSQGDHVTLQGGKVGGGRGGRIDMTI